MSHDDSIFIRWHIDDVLDVRSDLNQQQAREVLLRCKQSHDACIGINWDVIVNVADDLFPVNLKDDAP